MANLSDLVGFRSTLTACYKTESGLEIEFFRGLKISGKIFSRRYELSRDSRESILGAVVCNFILLVFSGGDSLLFFIFYFYFYLFIYLFIYSFYIYISVTSCSSFWRFSSFAWKA